MDVRELIARVLETVDGNQAELARRLGRSETTISRWVTGRNGIDYESALRIARMTGLPPRQVLEAAGLDVALFPSTTPGLDDADLSASKFTGALRGVPRRFWSVVVDASVALANAYADVPGATEGPVSDQQRPPVRTTRSRSNNRPPTSDGPLAGRQHRPLALLGAT